MDVDEHQSTTVFREYLRIRTDQPDPDYGKNISESLITCANKLMKFIHFFKFLVFCKLNLGPKFVHTRNNKPEEFYIYHLGDISYNVHCKILIFFCVSGKITECLQELKPTPKFQGHICLETDWSPGNRWLSTMHYMMDSNF